MKIEDLVKRFNGTTVKDIYGAMRDTEDIKEAFGLDIKIQEKTQYFKLEDGRYIKFDFEFKPNSNIWFVIWIQILEDEEE